MYIASLLRIVSSASRAAILAAVVMAAAGLSARHIFVYVPPCWWRLRSNLGSRRSGQFLSIGHGKLPMGLYGSARRK